MPGYEWVSGGDKSPGAGKTLLVGPLGAVAVLNFQNYVLSLDDSTLLVWHQYPRAQRALPSPPVHFVVLNPSELTPLDADLDGIYALMTPDTPLHFAGQPVASLDLSTTRVGVGLEAAFPYELRRLDELLILCHSSGIDSDPGWERDNLALMIARPAQSSYSLHPQDWYNGGGFDYGYQWVSRVIRNPSTGAIHGEGVRLEPFVLDETLRCRANPG